MFLFAVIFFGAALITVSITFFIVSRMVSQLEQIVAPERRISLNFMNPRHVIREHNRSFPQSELILAFWLSLIYLAVWVSGIVLSLAMDLSYS